MNTLSLTVRYRPLRMGWCVQSGDFDALRTAIEFSNVFWGGRYNPIIPADQRDLADQLKSGHSYDGEMADEALR